MKKYMKILLALLISVSVFIPSNCKHVHDNNCRYNEETQTGCTHVHTDECYGIDPSFWNGDDEPQG